MPIRLVRIIRTPWAPYAVTFSRDGTRLAFGGGSFYGHGGIHVAEVDGDRRAALDWEKVPWVVAGGIHSLRSMVSGVPTVSGLSFSDDDRFLAASMWGTLHAHVSAMLFEVEGSELNPSDVFENIGFDPFIEPNSDERQSSLGIATGVLLHDSFVIVRRHSAAPAGRHVIVLSPLPSDCPVRAGGAMQHLTHSRLSVVRGSVVTEAGGSRGVHRRQPDGTYAQVHASEGLAFRRLREPSAPPDVVPIKECPRVTAIVALPGNQGFITGGNQGQIDEWRWDNGWRQQRLRAAIAPVVSKSQELERQPESILAIVITAVTNQVVAVSTSGNLLIQRDGGEWECEGLPERGSPRSLAAHPSRPWVAVGLKQGGFIQPESAIAMLALEP